MITRDLSAAAAHTHDVAIIGGGIYGACLALESARRGLRPLLVERADFGGATSWNSLRILHGGLRYLQTLDVRRSRESAAEQAWFCRTFPDLVKPLECLLPLYGRGLKRPLVFGAAVQINRLLAQTASMATQQSFLHADTLLGATETIARFPFVNRAGLLGSGVWRDAAMVSPQRILVEILRWACSLGAVALNYVEAVDLVVRANRVEGIHVRDALSGRTHTFAARTVCSCAGPWAEGLAARFAGQSPAIFRPSLAFNLLLDREAPSESAVAVTSGRGSGSTYFLYPALGGVLAGTVHRPWEGNITGAAPDEPDLQRFLDELNAAIPGYDVKRHHVRRIFAGLLPVTGRGTTELSTRAQIIEHGRRGGPAGVFSVSGVKFTTARLTAERTAQSIARYLGRPLAPASGNRPASGLTINVDTPDELFSLAYVTALRRLAREESVITVDDLIMRRTNWGVTTADSETLRSRVAVALAGLVTDATDQRASATTGSRLRSA